MMTCPDVALRGLLMDRTALLQRLALVVRRVGASHPTRSKVNAKRAKQRKAIKRALRANSEQIAARCVELYAP